ncbi:GPI ethanolamine phosphate transferase 3 [Erysiphe neolycopersici]|uniref:GPI ethanolamine phosphate transferase 3 n=1 Tax=Erysiphe neolycopersici TaxID=212602 RepID=A0A420HXK9_9PEZI|nr:GPI ethanolamine phosphate transferase 3 [Erysiphe neolycopersici]
MSDQNVQITGNGLPRVPGAFARKDVSAAAQYIKSKVIKKEKDIVEQNQLGKAQDLKSSEMRKKVIYRLNQTKKESFIREWHWGLAFFIWLLSIHAIGIYFFTKGFLLTRLVLKDKSSCEAQLNISNGPFKGMSTYNAGCWHPKSYEKAVIIVVDALRYDFTVPYAGNHQSFFHNKLPYLYDTAIKKPHSAFLLPFIADPPTTTLQRLKGLTTGTLPTLIDLGSSFSGTAIEEDNLLIQLKDAGKRIVHLGDDTWTKLFPNYFEKNISRAYDSFNVWDLHTVDNGVTEHLMPLLEKGKKETWDIIIAHYLGVDHAGHRYGPDHPAMASKLEQMNDVLISVVSKMDPETLLVVMGDHGMDLKGDHGGESDDEVQSALWMYSNKEIFGRTNLEHFIPPKSAKERFVNQIDLVPTLALLLGVPIPFNNLGKPIQEAFASKKGNDWKNLASVAKISAAGIKKYISAYYTARGFTNSFDADSIETLWASGEKEIAKIGKKNAKDAYIVYSRFSDETLQIFRSLWAQFDLLSMAFGIGILTMSVILLIFYATEILQESPQTDNLELDQVQFQLELENFSKGIKTDHNNKTLTQRIFEYILIYSALGIIFSPVLWNFTRQYSAIDIGLAAFATSGLFGVFYQELLLKVVFKNILPKSYWGYLAFIFTASQAIGFASNSYTIWEDTILLFFISTFGLSGIISSFRINKSSDRALGIYHSFVFTFLGWVASFSKLCREEQMPYCYTTYYISSTSSTSALWQLVIPFVVALLLPAIIKSFYTGSRSYEGFAPIWVGWIFRIGLILNAIFWVLDAADDGQWYPQVTSTILKKIRVVIAQTVLASVIGAGTTAFIYAPPCVAVTTTVKSDSNSKGSSSSSPKLTIYGFANAHGTRYFLLILNVILGLLLLQKPMGAGVLSLMAWQILALSEILDLNCLTSSPIGPVMLALLGSFYFFKTGHQATLSSIQWESAFIPFHTIYYPYSPILVTLNTFGAQVISIAAVPLLVLWKQKPRKKNIFQGVLRGLAWHITYYAVMAALTSLWAAWLRRHLMLFRIFSPKFMTAAFVLLVVDVFGILVALVGFRTNILSVSEIFGWS